MALAAVGAGSVLYHGPMTAGAELAHDGSIAAFVAATCLAAWRRRSWPRPPALALAAPAAGVAVNLATRTGAPLCRPDSLVQGHAAARPDGVRARAGAVPGVGPCTRRSPRPVPTVSSS